MDAWKVTKRKKMPEKKAALLRNGIVIHYDSVREANNGMRVKSYVFSRSELGTVAVITAAEIETLDWKEDGPNETTLKKNVSL